jgi:predicted nucleotidyltransferase component of viral defense system
MKLEYVTKVSTNLKIKNLDLIEKDILLHQILTDLSNDNFFLKNFIFKGGTCLIKYYLGYVRFSEDIDFTWTDQSKFKGKTASKIRDDLSGIIDKTGKIVEKIASKRGLDFKCIKHNRNYVELGGSNKTCTFKVWYDSVIMKKKAFIKIQINFVEEMCTKSKKGRLNSLLNIKDEELDALFPEYTEYSKTIQFSVYTIKEILSEKIRALLTREGVKARDFLDVYLIQKKLGIRPLDVEKCVIKKLNHALKLYKKYRLNLEEKDKLLEKDNIFEWGKEKGLLLSEIDDNDFHEFIKEFTKYLKTLVKKLDR